MKQIQLLLIMLFFSNYIQAQQSNSSEEEIPLADLITIVDTASAPTLKNVLSGKYTSNLRSVRFNTGKTTLDSKEKMYLDTVADYLVNVPTIEMSIDGHTDNIGPYPKNKDLSLNRAKAVAEYLIQKGVRQGQLKTIGYGPDKPLVSNSSPQGRATNRRVELHFLKTDFDQIGGSGGNGGNKKRKNKMDNLTHIKLKNGSSVEAKFVSYSSDGKELRYIPNGPDETVKVLRIPDVESINYADGTKTIPENKPDPLPNSNAFQAAREEIRKRENKITVDQIPVKPVPVIPVIPDPNDKSTPSFVRKWEKIKHETRYGKYLSGNFVFVTAGILPLTIHKNDASLNITNTIGANYQSSLSANNNPFGFGIQIGMEREFGSSRPNTYYRYMYQWATIGGAQMNLFSFGVGKSMGRLKQYRYGLDLATGYAQKKLDNLVLGGNEYGVNNIRFNGNKVSVRYRNGYYAITPNVTYELYLGKLFAALRFNAGYTLSLYRRSVIKLKGQTTENPFEKTFVDVGGSTYYLTENNIKRSDEKIYGIGGFHVTGGLIFK